MLPLISVLLSACFGNNESRQTTNLALQEETVMFCDSLNEAEDETKQDRLGFVLDSLKSRGVEIACVISDRFVFFGTKVEELEVTDGYRVDQLGVFDIMHGRSKSRELSNRLRLKDEIDEMFSDQVYWTDILLDSSNIELQFNVTRPFSESTKWIIYPILTNYLQVEADTIILVNTRINIPQIDYLQNYEVIIHDYSVVLERSVTENYKDQERFDFLTDALCKLFVGALYSEELRELHRSLPEKKPELMHGHTLKIYSVNSFLLDLYLKQEKKVPNDSYQNVLC